MLIDIAQCASVVFVLFGIHLNIRCSFSPKWMLLMIKKIFDALGLHMGIVRYERKSDSGETLTEKEQTIVYTLEGKFRP